MSTPSKRKNSKPAPPPAEATPDIGGADPNNLDQIRSILFGAQMRETDNRFAQLEEQLNRDLTLLRETVSRRLDELEAFVREENEALAKRLTSEQRQREEAADELQAAINKVSKASKASRTELETAMSDQERALRQRMLTQSKELSDDMERRFDALQTMIRDAVDQLGDNKTDRRALADLFEEVAGRLRGEFALPGSE